MPTILNSKSIYYNDVNLIARPSSINSRSEIPKEFHRIIVSPMESVVGEKFAIESDRLGLTVCLHRFCDIEKQIDIFHKLKNKQNVFASVGLKDTERLKKLFDCGVENILIDCANGYLPAIKNCLNFINYVYSGKLNKIMLGNVMTDTGFYNLTNCIANTYIRVGIAGGSACSTSDATGYNRGQITEIMECHKCKKSIGYTMGKQTYLIADGGIKNGNYAAKAFGSGADFVMLGGYFSRAIEAETHVIGDGNYWGGASSKQHERIGIKGKHSEGKVYKVTEELKPLEVLVNELWGGLSSAVSYSGYSTLTEFIGNGVFEIKQNSLPPKR